MLLFFEKSEREPGFQVIVVLYDPDILICKFLIFLL